MNKRERYLAALGGRDVDRVPITFWRHFPIVDQSPAEFASAVTAYQRRFDFDVVIVAPSVTDAAEDWGIKSLYLGNVIGTRHVVGPTIVDWTQWLQLAPLQPGSGRLGGQLDALRRIRAGLGEAEPILHVVLSPFSIARQLRGPGILADLVEHPIEVREGLRAIVESLTWLALGALDAGADGIYFAASSASTDVVSEPEYRVYGVGYDAIVLDEIRRRTDQIVVGVPESAPMFDLLATYPAAVLNWEDRVTGPSVAEGLKRISGAALGGVDERNTLWSGPPLVIAAQVRDAIRQARGRRLIVGPGGPIPVDTPDDHIQTARSAV